MVRDDCGAATGRTRKIAAAALPPQCCGTDLPMKTLMSIAAVSLLWLASAARAEEKCEACRPEDERQIGEYVEPEIPSPRATTPDDPRGREVTLPAPGAPIVRHRPGAGVFIGEAGPGNNVFVNGSRSKATIGVKRDF